MAWRSSGSSVPTDSEMLTTWNGLVVYRSMACWIPAAIRCEVTGFSPSASSGSELSKTRTSMTSASGATPSGPAISALTIVP